MRTSSSCCRRAAAGSRQRHGGVAFADPRVQRQQQFVGGDGRCDAMVKLQPSLSVAARISARWRCEPRLVVGAPVLGAAGGDLAAAFGLDELDAAGIGEGFLGRIDDLDQMALRAGGGKLGRWSRGSPRSGSTGRRSARSRRAAPARSPAAGSAARCGSCMIASAMRSITARLPVGRIRPGTPTRSPASTSTSASANATTSVRSSLLSRASARGECHRRRTVRPDPDGVRGLPFLLAHVEIVVARRAAPVDAARLLAGDVAAELPEVLAGAGAPAAVQAVDHGGGDLARFQDEPRHRRRRARGRPRSRAVSPGVRPRPAGRSTAIQIYPMRA